MKNKKLIIAIVVIVIILIAGYFIWRAWRIKQRQAALSGVIEGGTTTVPGSSSGSGSGYRPVYSDAFPLKVGSVGNNVTAFQYAVNEGCPEITTEITIDGKFGPQSEAAANVCLAGQQGHSAGQVSYAEYQWLTKRISFAEDQQMKKGCTASAASRAMMKTFWGIDCAEQGY